MRYAKALLAYADDAKVEDAVYREALLLKDSYAQVPELRNASCTIPARRIYSSIGCMVAH